MTVILRSQLDYVLQDMDDMHDDDGLTRAEMASILELDELGTPPSTAPDVAEVARAVETAMWDPYAEGTPSALALTVYRKFMHKYESTLDMDTGYCMCVSMRAADAIVRSMTGIDRSARDRFMCQCVVKAPSGSVTVRDDVSDDETCAQV